MPNIKIISHKFPEENVFLVRIEYFYSRVELEWFFKVI